MPNNSLQLQFSSTGQEGRLEGGSEESHVQEDQGACHQVVETAYRQEEIQLGWAQTGKAYRPGGLAYSVEGTACSEAYHQAQEALQAFRQPCSAAGKGAC
jgi:hypothetical protein